MGYNVTDLIDKAINIAKRRKTIYEKIEEDKCDIPSIKIISKVLAKNVETTIQYYEILKKEISDAEFDEIDFSVYDKMSFLVSEFNNKIYTPELNNVRDFLRFSLDLEKDVYSLLIDLQGRFVKCTEDLHTRTYKILSDMINNKANHIVTLEKILK